MKLSLGLREQRRLVAQENLNTVTTVSATAGVAQRTGGSKKVWTNYCLNKIIFGQTASDKSFNISSIKRSDSIDRSDSIYCGDSIDRGESIDRGDSTNSGDSIESIDSHDKVDGMDAVKE